MRNLRVPDPHATWTEDEGRAALEAWRASGESLAAFARREGIDVQRLYWWKRRLGRTRTTARARATSSLSLVPAAVIEAAAVVTIRLPNGIEIEAANGAPAWVAAMVTALSRSLP